MELTLEHVDNKFMPYEMLPYSLVKVFMDY